MPAVYLAPMFDAGAQFFDNSGVVLNGGYIYTYEAGTTTPLATYTDSTGNNANTNPIVLNSSGRLANAVWVTRGVAYKFELSKLVSGVPVSLIQTDNVFGILSPDSPAFTGNPTAPTQTAGNNSTRLATTAFVATSFAPLASPTFTGTATFVTISATTISATGISATSFTEGGTLLTNKYATLATPTFTGVPAAPTAPPGTNTTQLATTAFVATSFAPLASPVFTGGPSLPSLTTGITQSTQDNSNRIATTAYVQAWSGLFIQEPPNTYNVAQTLTAADIINHLIIGNPGGTVDFTLPTVTTLEGSLTNPLVSSAIEFSVLNLSGFTITIVTNTGWTLTGAMTILTGTARRFRGRRTGAGAWTLYLVG